MFSLHNAPAPLLLIMMVLTPHLGWHAYAQSTSTTITSTSTTAAAAMTTSTASSSAAAVTTSSISVSSAAATTTYTGTPSLVFNSIPTLTACGSNLFTWQITNEDPALVNLTLYVINEGVDQSIPSASSTSSPTTSKVSTTTTTSSSTLKPSTTSTSSSSSALLSTTSAARVTTTSTSVTSASAATTSLTARSILNINMTLGIASGNHGWTFNPVKLPQGRYYLLGVVHDGHGTTAKSGVFSVIEGSNTTCLTEFANESKTATATATAKTTGAKTSGTAIGAGSGSSSNQGGISKGAIAGIVIGVILALVLGIIVLLYLRRRRRRSQVDGGDGYTQPPMSNVGAGGRHIKMPSGPTTSSDQGHGHGQLPITLKALSSDGENEKGRSNESLVETMAVDINDNSHGIGRREEVSNPFITPQLQHDSAYGGYTISDFAPTASSSSSSGGIGIREPSQAILRPLSYTDPRSGRQSGQYTGGGGGAVYRSSSQSRSGSGQTTPPGIGLGISSGSASASGGNTPAGVGQIGRSSSTRRKPVPSLGPELKSQLQQQQAKQTGSGTGAGAGQRKYKLAADLPRSEMQ